MIQKVRAWDDDSLSMRMVKAMVLEDGEFNRVVFAGCDVKSGHNLKWRGWKYIHKTKLMLYTGSKDMNKTDIYEGDIIRKEECSPDDPAFGCYGSVGVVKYYPAVMGFIIDTTDTGDTGFYDNMGVNFSFNEIEVIGNIYATPEILE